MVSVLFLYVSSNTFMYNSSAPLMLRECMTTLFFTELKVFISFERPAYDLILLGCFFYNLVYDLDVVSY